MRVVSQGLTAEVGTGHNDEEITQENNQEVKEQQQRRARAKACDVKIHDGRGMADTVNA